MTFQFNLIEFYTANGHVILTLLNSIPPSPEKRMLVTPPALAALKSQVVDHRHAKSVHIRVKIQYTIWLPFVNHFLNLLISKGLI